MEETIFSAILSYCIIVCIRKTSPLTLLQGSNEGSGIPMEYVSPHNRKPWFGDHTSSLGWNKTGNRPMVMRRWTERGNRPFDFSTMKRTWKPTLWLFDDETNVENRPCVFSTMKRTWQPTLWLFDDETSVESDPCLCDDETSVETDPWLCDLGLSEFQIIMVLNTFISIQVQDKSSDIEQQPPFGETIILLINPYHWCRSDFRKIAQHNIPHPGRHFDREVRSAETTRATFSGHWKIQILSIKNIFLYLTSIMVLTEGRINDNRNNIASVYQVHEKFAFFTWKSKATACQNITWFMLKDYSNCVLEFNIMLIDTV